MNTARQLPLPFPFEPGFDADGFLSAESNEEARAWVFDSPWPEQRLAVWGEAGRGKTHLLHVWAARTGAEIRSALTLRGLPDAPPAAGLALDDADLAPEETALLHLLNTARDLGRRVLLAGRAPPARWMVQLPDLASRLRATAAVELHAPEDSLRRSLLDRLLAERQLQVTQPARDWMLLHLPRTAFALREAAALLDRASLARGSRVTRSQVMTELEFAELDRLDP